VSWLDYGRGGAFGVGCVPLRLGTHSVRHRCPGRSRPGQGSPYATSPQRG